MYSESIVEWMPIQDKMEPVHKLGPGRKVTGKHLSSSRHNGDSTRSAEREDTIETSAVNLHVLLCSPPGDHPVRHRCVSYVSKEGQPEKLRRLRQEIWQRKSERGAEMDAYIVTSDDEHQSQSRHPRDNRRAFITGFTGSDGWAVITLTGAALWTDSRYFGQADEQLTCDWELMRMGLRNTPTIPQWLKTQLMQYNTTYGIPPRVGADPRLVPHVQWEEWRLSLEAEGIRLVEVFSDMIDKIWGKERPPPSDVAPFPHSIKFAGVDWFTKVTDLRKEMAHFEVNAMVVTSLTEVAWLLNIRGTDTAFTPVVKAYTVIDFNQIILYTNLTKVNKELENHLGTGPCQDAGAGCVRFRDYDAIREDLRVFSRKWTKVLLPTHCVYDFGVSQAIYNAIPAEQILLRQSPIIMMRAIKNKEERRGMRNAHLRDAVAMCEFLAYFEEQVMLGVKWDELRVAREVDRSRRAQDLSRGLSFATIAAYGPHGALPHYEPTKDTSLPIEMGSTLVIDSGGQYADGTTDVTRTVHMGEPTPEQRAAYTRVLAGQIQLATLIFPGNLRTNEVDVLARGPQWQVLDDYGHGTGHGIGSYLSVHESPISIAFGSKQKFQFKEGYFFSNEPGHYEPGNFGVRLENILEVVLAKSNSHSKESAVYHSSDSPYLAFREATLVPYESKLINKEMLSSQQKLWLNNYNSRIRQIVGAELKHQMKMKAFYWMMNKTREIPDCQKYNTAAIRSSTLNIVSLAAITVLISYSFFTITF